MDAEVPEVVRPAMHRPVVFFSEYGLRSGWRFALFIVIYAALTTALYFAIHPFFPSRPGETIRPGPAIAQEGSSVVAVLIATWIMAWLEKKPFSAFGLGGENRLSRAMLGVLCGFGFLSALLLVLYWVGTYQYGVLALRGESILLYAFLWGVAFTLVGFNEELTCRGYALFSLSQGIGFWPAAIILSLIFGAGHVHNRGEDYIGISAAVLIGLVLAYSLRRTGSLWWAIGFHAAWDWGESYFYGVRDSGIVVSGHLLASGSRGPGWLSGGEVGPEGSALVFLAIIGLAVLIYLAFGPVNPSGLERLKSRPVPAETQ